MKMQQWVIFVLLTLSVAVNNIHVETITTENETINPICIVTQQLLCADFTLLSLTQNN
jgi:hypothetical protein